jgi:hypothetical protein
MTVSMPLRQDGRHFHGNESAANNHGTFRRGRALSNALRIGKGAQVVDPGQRAAWNIQSLHGRAGSDDELFKSNLATRLQAEEFLRDVYAADFGTQFKFDFRDRRIRG